VNRPPATAHVASRWWIATASLAAGTLLLIGFGGLLHDRNSDTVRTTESVAGIPVTVLRPATDGQFPGLVVAHGFAGSAVLMDGLGSTWARAGFAVALLDFAGHGGNPDPLQVGDQGSDSDRQLPQQVSTVSSWLLEQRYVEGQQVGLVGHSMGAGAVVAAAAADPPRYGSTVALSLPSAEDVPFGQPAIPRNLLLLWGAAEQPRFEQAALEGLQAAYPDAQPGARYGDVADGTAREARAVPGAEHLSILWRTDTAQWSYDWLAAAAGLPAGAVTSAPRMFFFAAAALGGLLALVPLTTALLGNRKPSITAAIPGRRVVLIAVLAAVAASLFAAVAAPIGERVPLAVGGHLALWFGSGAAALLLGARWAGAGRQSRTFREGVAAVALAGWLTVVLAASGRLAWAPFELVGSRPWLFVLFLTVLAGWFGGDAHLVRRASRGRGAFLLLANRIVLVAALLGGVFLLDAPGFLLLLLPLMVPLLAMLATAAWITTGRTGSVLVPAAVQAAPLSLLIATTFPLVASA
jgi:dienelactone hydrolase